jgi:polar amino acid transport system substrate-binding protein
MRREDIMPKILAPRNFAPSVFAAGLLLVATVVSAFAQGAPPPDALKDLAPTGKLRAAINFGNGVLAQKGPNGEPHGITPDLATALSKRLGVPVEFVTREAAGKVAELLSNGEVDIGFIAIEPVRAAQIEFSPPYLVIEGTYMVRTDSPR